VRPSSCLTLFIAGTFFSSCWFESAADKASKNLAKGIRDGLKGIDTDVLKIEAGKKDAVALDRLQRGEESIIVQVTECVGTFKLQGSLHTKTTQENIWTTRVSDILGTGPRPVPPTKPDPKKVKGFAYARAKANYDAKLRAYTTKAAKWQQHFNRMLVDNGFDIAPNFADPGLYAFRLIITPESETNDDWKFRLTTRVESLDGKSKQFKVFSVEKRDLPNHPLGQPLAEHLLVFNAD
jgi:hypothetical protein